MEPINKDQLPDLETAAVAEAELNPFAFDPTDYPPIEAMLNSRAFNSPESTSADLIELSKNGSLLQDPMNEYLAKKAASSSALKEALKTPFHYFYYTNQKRKVETKDHFELGNFAHMAFLEPERFDKYIIEPDLNMTTKEGVMGMIRFYEKCNAVSISAFSHLETAKIGEMREYLSTLRGQCPYSVVAREYQDIIDVLNFNYKNYGGGIIPKILKGASHEVSFYGKDPVTGLSVKVRPDAFNIEENIGVNAIISFKTTSAQSVPKFIYDTAKFQYELSEGMYQKVVSDITGRKFNVTIMVMLQTVPPFLPAVFWWDAEDLANGKYKYRVALDTVKECTEKQTWPGFDAAAESGNCGLIDLQQPDWSKKELHPVDVEN
jgi:hypothetical protein